MVCRELLVDKLFPYRISGYVDAAKEGGGECHSKEGGGEQLPRANDPLEGVGYHRKTLPPYFELSNSGLPRLTQDLGSFTNSYGSLPASTLCGFLDSIA